MCPAPLRYRWAAIRRGTSAWFWTRACTVRMMAALSGFCACARHAAMRCRSPQICPRHLDRQAAKTAFISEDSGESARCRNAGTRKSHPTGRGGPGEPVRDLLTDVYARADWLDTDWTHINMSQRSTYILRAVYDNSSSRSCFRLGVSPLFLPPGMLICLQIDLRSTCPDACYAAHVSFPQLPLQRTPCATSSPVLC